MSILRRDAIRYSLLTAAGFTLSPISAPFSSSTETKSFSHESSSGPDISLAPRHQSPTLSRQLARFVNATDFENLPPSIIEGWKSVVLDTLGVGIAGSIDRLAHAVSKVAIELGCADQCTLINQQHRCDAAKAAFINGTQIGTPQSDSWSGAHAASNVLPALLAIAEQRKLSGRAFLAALALGAEVGGRIGAASVGVERVRGFHNPGIQGVFGSAVAVGKLLQLDEDQLVHALGIAGSSAAGLQEFAWEGADMKATHAGRAAQLGLESALLASTGVLGPSTVLEGPFGYFNAFSLPTDPNKVVENLNLEAMRIPEHKHFAMHTTHQLAIAAILQYTSEHTIDPDRIEQVIIRGPESIIHPRHRALEPTTLMGARYSLPFTAAVALTRDISDPLNYDESTLRDPLVLSLAHRVILQPANTNRAGPHGLFSDVSLVVDGRTIELQPVAVKGFYDSPYTWEDAVEKFQRFTHRLIGKQQSIELIDLVAGINDLDDLGVLALATAKRP